MGKKLRSQLNGGGQGQGGFGPFMSLLMDERVGTATSRQQNNVGRVIKRGKSIAMTEAACNHLLDHILLFTSG
ncbi:small nuclear ribonucleoprotein G-like [Lynx canadensis]|uniref:small nuclear ribonucleoprotein G-like n=1 Tax=Lynx canadensis TaxID=61383 RepID=UPI0013C4DD59|nr:small nuclear ribonucleoprotein G-like [Lynx canadensis]XP_046957205.1 small nuclear ribonucleoprotein G-like [Lynx rufus]